MTMTDLVHLFVKPGVRQPQAVHAWFLRITSVRECLYVYVCVSSPEAINN